jgi:hypothetical protein
MAGPVYEFLISRKLSLALFGVICLLSIPGTLPEQGRLFSTVLFRSVLGLIALNLLLCTLARAKKLAYPVLIIHSGAMVTLLGGVISTLGFIATVNIYEGGSIDQVYRWDRGEDVSLGYEIAVKQMHRLYHPVPVQVGVLRGDAKIGLFTLKTGETFTLDSYTVKVDELRLPSETLQFSISDQGRPLGTADSEGAAPPSFPYRFVLVAYKNPVLKRTWVDIQLGRGTAVIAQGPSEVNAPFEWNGLSFYHTSNDSDDQGRPYAGIQIVKDPGREVVFAGFSIILIGVVLWMKKKLSGAGTFPPYRNDIRNGQSEGRHP